MRIAVITINKSTDRLAKKIRADFNKEKIFHYRDNLEKIFTQYDGLVFIASLGIVVRLIAPLVKNKFSDPAVVCVDSAGRYAISVLSGHEGGANKLAFLVAAGIGAQPIISTGTESRKKFILGIGTCKGIGADQVKETIQQALAKKGIALEKIRAVATVDLKKNEKGLIKACASLNLPLLFIPKEDIRDFQGNISHSKVVKRYLGLGGVCEPCALLAARRTRLILKKQIFNRIAIAIAREG